MPSPAAALLTADATADPRRLWAGYLALVAVFFGVLVWRFHGLRFPLDRDEGHYWPTSVAFSHGLSWHLLRHYNELNTPLAFVLFGWFQRLTGHGLVLARWFNVALAAGVVVLVGAQGSNRRRAMAAGFGLMACPYFLAVATHAYSDTLAMALAVAGALLTERGRRGWAAVAFALAIATRQYMVAFPAAYAADAAWAQLRRRAQREVSAWLWPALAAATLGGWIVFFGGLSPMDPLGGPSPLHGLTVRNALVLLACLGGYFLLPEVVLLPASLRRLRRPTLGELAVVAGVLLVAFVFFPPLANTVGSPVIPSFGLMDRGLRAAAPDAVRLGIYYVLALGALLRFQLVARATTLWLIAANAGLMMLAPVAWEKYALPLLAVLWLREAFELA